MKHVIQNWEISELKESKNQIDPKPQYQRTPVWTKERKAFLIDSILRGYDIPKIYLKFLEKRKGKNYFEVVDGQQRLRAIWDFLDNTYALDNDFIFNGINYNGRTYSELPSQLKSAFTSFVIVICEILESNPGEINELFTRLQKGVALNPSELRHALISNIGKSISHFIEQQKLLFFNADCKIEDKRFKHQDYIDHVIALVHYKNNKDLKAATLYQLYVDHLNSPASEYQKYLVDAKVILSTMKSINSFNKGIFKNKWGFVDVYWLLERNKKKLKELDPREFAQRFSDFELDRKRFNDNPGKILRQPKATKFGKNLYTYIEAFNKEGANKKNLKARADVLDEVFKDIL